ncbi:MAG: zf-HC2 domain-containing protein [Magnetococcales bacterium]|nr:zf-HC2 domain-containing protein [Magnetococcales bacterium]
MQQSCDFELVSAFLDGEIDHSLVRPLTEHLRECEACRQLLVHLAQAQEAVMNAFLIPDPESLTASVMAAIEADEAENPPPKPTPVTFQEIIRTRLVRYGVPAAILASLMAGIAHYTTVDEPVEKPISLKQARDAALPDWNGAAANGH